MRFRLLSYVAAMLLLAGVLGANLTARGGNIRPGDDGKRLRMGRTDDGAEVVHEDVKTSRTF